MPTPFIDLKKVEEVKKYASKGLNISQIARLMQKDYKTTYRWYSYAMGSTKYIKRVKVYGKLSTDKI